ncbi:MAG: efflux RND transporter periplasmic adaptor subunit [Chloroflexi bacterium]|nr:efflux RND transporter periplasmic adaptor subunit [Chloroflexota bacterium]
MKRAAILTGAVALTILVAAGWLGYQRAIGSAGAARQSTPQPEAKTVAVAKGTVRQVLTVPGEAAAPRQRKLSFPVSGRLAEVGVSPGDDVTDGQFLARISTSTLEKAVSRAEAELDQKRMALSRVESGPRHADIAVAEIDLQMAVAKLDQSKAGPPASDLAAAEGAVADASAELENAKLNLAVVQKSEVAAKNVRERQDEHQWYEANYGTQLKRHERGEIGKDELNKHWSNLMTAKEKLDGARAQAALALSEAQSRVARAEENVRKAQARLAEIKAGPPPENIRMAELEAQKARARLAQLSAGPDPVDLEQAAVAVRLAETALERAQSDLAAATLLAPFTGKVVGIGAQPGDEVSAGTSIIELADLSYVEVLATVGQEDIGLVKLGQSAVLTFDATPDESFSGQVSRIVPKKSEGPGVVTYEIVISLERVPLRLLPGMTGDAEITVAERRDVLTLPRRALRARPNATVPVKILEGEIVASRDVKIGLVGDLDLEVLSGLHEGDRVIVEP